MIWVQFAATTLVIVLAGVRLARYGDVLGEKTGLGRSWIGVVPLAATTSLPELFTGFGATALTARPTVQEPAVQRAHFSSDNIGTAVRSAERVGDFRSF